MAKKWERALSSENLSVGESVGEPHGGPAMALQCGGQAANGGAEVQGDAAEIDPSSTSASASASPPRQGAYYLSRIKSNFE